MTRKPGWEDSLSKSSIGVGEISLIAEREFTLNRRRSKDFE